MRSPAAVLGAVMAGLLSLGAKPAAVEEPPRTVIVRLAVDSAIPELTEWRFQANAFIEGTVRTFHSRFGIKLVFKGPSKWLPGRGLSTLEDGLKDLSVRVKPDGSDIVLGIIDPSRLTSPSLGIASYIGACVLIGNAIDPRTMKYAMLHELSHVFGAIDLKEKGSLMSAEGHTLDFDEFTSGTILLHKNRSFARGSFPLSSEEIDAAIPLYRKRADLHLGETELLQFLTLFYVEKGDLDAAARACTEAAQENPNAAEIQAMLGNIRLGRGEAELAIDHYVKALEHHPQDPGLHYSLGLALSETKRYKEAADQFRTSLKIKSDYVPARLAMAGLLLAAGSSEAAADECRRALESEPQSAQALYLLGTAMLSLDRPFTPVPEAEQADGLEVPNSIKAGSHEAEMAVVDAVRYLEMSIAIDPHNPRAHISLGAAYAAMKKFGEAESAYLQALNLQPDDLDAHFGLGRLYMERGDMGKAADHLEKILSIEPGSELGSRMINGAFQVPRSYPLYRRKAGK